MGGDQNPNELADLLNNVHRNQLKTALYTGEDSMQNISFGVLCNLDYCKIGHYDVNKGGLDNKNTNQKMFIRNHTDSKWDDITYKFQKG